MSPEMQIVRREVGLGSVILQNHRKKVLKATEERLMELAGNFMGVDVIQKNLQGFLLKYLPEFHLNSKQR